MPSQTANEKKLAKVAAQSKSLRLCPTPKTIPNQKSVPKTNGKRWILAQDFCQGKPFREVDISDEARNVDWIKGGD